MRKLKPKSQKETYKAYQYVKKVLENPNNKLVHLKSLKNLIEIWRTNYYHPDTFSQKSTYYICSTTLFLLYNTVKFKIKSNEKNS